MQDLPWSGFSLHGVSLARRFVPRREDKTNHRDTEAQRVRRESDNTAILDILGSFWEFWYLLAFPSLYGLDNLKLGTEILTES